MGSTVLTGVHVHGAGVNLPLEGLVGADGQLLARLAASVEGALHLVLKERLSSRPPYSRANGTPWATHWSMIPALTAAYGKRSICGSGNRHLDGVGEQAVDRITVILAFAALIPSGRDRVARRGESW